jgi:hypothetical protein
MTRLRIQSVFQMLVLSAAVAVLSGLVPVLPAHPEGRSLPAVQSSGGDTLMADGGDPQPPPRPLPWLGIAA